MFFCLYVDFLFHFICLVFFLLLVFCLFNLIFISGVLGFCLFISLVLVLRAKGDMKLVGEGDGRMENIKIYYMKNLI